MTYQGGYFDLLDWLTSEKGIRPQQFFRRMQKAFGLANLLYAEATVTPAGVRLHRLHHTFTPVLVRAVSALPDNVTRPSIREAFHTISVLDWSWFIDRTIEAQTFHQLSADLSIAPHGVVYPLAAREGRAAVMVVNSNLPSAEWARYRRQNDPYLHHLAAQFHARLVAGRTPHSMYGRRKFELTVREREALTWAAAGKSYWETSVILGISERTVRFFMSNARRKLNVATNTQAVAEAVWRGLITTNGDQ
ncbi:MAG: transcriptional regulator [Shinella sp.]|nr:MAG: transcriptional regulator [Shinella sp.]